ncbi:helix-turn-helix domain-containing protein [Streptomyces sp. NEAU-sy36]|uniref:nSTAND1 domain-containing NTPase n=1 Tax=unclassified Streptomyces TaxID=2593676 RepID=UPI0015D5CD6B|nr:MULTISPECIES: helix-turn-helix domain-containing protein [unclassified Streptomyces]QLJ02757.1 helix-turn-helix domain-containing protein [Streptomyces sp. NEAU-sy36]
MQLFAFELRKLRQEAGGLTYRDMAQRAGYSVATLSRAATGEQLPSLEVVVAYVRACGADAATWERRWRAVAQELNSRPKDGDQPGPYRGLARFEPRDAGLFFGRDRLTDRLVDLTSSRRFVGVFGASGSGKSSLLRAGLIPRLRSADLVGPRPAAVRVLTPGEHPMRTHAQRLVPADGSGDTWLIVDQFEELYTLCSVSAEREQFIDHLLTACDPASRMRVVVAVRADFLGRCAEHAALADALQEGTVLAGPLSREELREAVVRPAQSAGLIVERALTARILDDVEDESGALPLMSHALLETWHRRKGRVLTLDAYDAIGGLQAAVARTAEDVYTRFSPAQAALARRVLLRLTTPGQGSPDTRRPTRRADFDIGDSTDTAVVLERLIQARLIVVDDDVVDLAHETLLTAWPRLRGWIEEDRECLLLHRRLTEAAQAWEELGRDPGALYRGTRLTAAHEQLRAQDLTAMECAFLTASLTARDQERRASARTTRRLRILTVTLSVLLALATTAGLLAWQQSRTSDQQRDVAQSRELAARSEAVLPRLPEAAMMLALKGFHTAPTVEARGSLLSAYARYTANQLTGHTAPIQALAFSPDGRILATASADHSVKLWDTSSHQLMSTLAGHTDAVTAVAFSPDGRMLASASADHSVKLWDTSTQRETATLTGHTNTVNAVAFGPGGHILATGSSDGTVRLWDTATRRTASVLNPHTGAVLAMAFSPDGATLATAGTDHTVHLWSMASRRVTATLTGCKDAVRAVSFSPSGRTVAAGSDDGTARLWSVTTARPLAVLEHSGDSLTAVAFSPDGRSVATAGLVGVNLWDTRKRRTIGALPESSAVVAFSPDGRTLATGHSDPDAPTARLWNAATRKQTATLGDSSAAYRVAFSPDGHTLATAFSDGTVQLWDLSRHHQTAAWKASLAVWGMAFSPDGRTLATGGYDHTLRLWDTATHRQTATLTGHTHMILAVAFSPDGRTLATGSYDGTVRLWDVAARRAIAVLRGHTNGVFTLTFSPDSRTLVTAGDDRTVRLWSVAGHRGIAVLRGHSDTVSAVAFSPNGRVLASTGRDRTVRLWSAASHRSIAVLRGHTDIVSGVSFTPDGRTLITGSYDRTIRLWQVDTARTLAVLDGDTGSINSTALSPDGRSLATTGTIGDRRVWSLDPERTAERICQASRTHHWSDLLAYASGPRVSC